MKKMYYWKENNSLIYMICSIMKIMKCEIGLKGYKDEQDIIGDY